MIYRPPEPLSLWDSWLFEWEETFHLFFLETHETTWDHVGHAVSSDLVHWTARPSIRIKGGPGDWNENASNTQTGMVVRHDGRFYMFAGANYGPKSCVGIYTSDDLDNWTPHPENPVMCAAGPHYVTEAPAPRCPRADWRDPCVQYREEDGHYHALIFARRSAFSNDDTGAVVGHLRSRDLIHWEHLPPLDAPTGKFYNNEVPDLFELGGKYYLLFSTGSGFGTRINTPSRDDTMGTYYMVGDGPDGPFELPEDPLLIGVGGGKIAAYVGRTIPYRGGRLLYHHIAASRPTWGLPKRVARGNDESLHLRCMPDLVGKLETNVICGPDAGIPCFDVRDLGDWQRQDGRITGRAPVASSSCKVATGLGDFHLTCRIRLSSGARAGVILRSADDEGAVVNLNFERRRMEISRVERDPQNLGGWGGDRVHDTHRCELGSGTTYHLRCLARDEHFEVYLGDRWVFALALGDVARSGDVELTVERGQATFSDLRLAELEPLP